MLASEPSVYVLFADGIKLPVTLVVPVLSASRLLTVRLLLVRVCIVELAVAYNPPVNPISVEVALAAVEPNVLGVNGNAPLPAVA